MMSVLVCHGCDGDVGEVAEWVDTFYGNPRFIGPYCEQCVREEQDRWEG
jgi:hypothetical protein